MKAFICGAGAQGRVVLDILRQAAQFEQFEFIDDNEELWGQGINGARVAGGFEHLLRQDRTAFRAIVSHGHPGVRTRLANRMKEHSLAWINAVHPSAVLAPSARLGTGNMISAGAIVNSNATIGDHAIVNTAAVVEHDCVVESFATVCAGVQLGGRTTVGRGAFVCTGAIVLPRVVIGAGSAVAAGAVVTKPVPEGVLVLGAPARIHAKIGEDRDWERFL